MCRASNLSELKRVIGQYQGVSGLTLGLDVRYLQPRYYSVLLKFMEDEEIHLVIRMLEPVPFTILSRSMRVVKYDKVERLSGFDILYPSGGKTLQKIRDLK